LFVQILMAVSFIAAGYQDFRERLVSDLVWIPAVIGVVLTLYFAPSGAIYLLIRIAVVGGMAFVVTRLGYLGEADGIAFVIIAAVPQPLDLLVLIFAIAAVALSAIGYLYLSGMAGKDRVISLKQFKSEARWIPQAIVAGGERKDVDKNVNVSREEVEKITDESAMVEVQYGVPNIEYMAGGYIIFLVFLAIFQPSVLTSLP
jgi:hypothetical protein